LKGHEAHHVIDVGLADAPDAAIWAWAIAEGSMIVTKDRDFVDWALARTPRTRILWIRFGNMRRDALLARIEGAWRDLSHALESDVTIVEIGR
jgi:predicted nuclease of predicted toxin-antitoxin system